MLFYHGFPGSSAGKESACNAGDWVWSLGWGNPLEKGKAPHSSTVAWRSPWTVQSQSWTRLSSSHCHSYGTCDSSHHLLSWSLWYCKTPWKQAFKNIYLCTFGCSGSSLLRGGYPLLRSAGFSLQRLPLLRSTGCRCSGFSQCGLSGWSSQVVKHELRSCDAQA